jgi:hypothetical protein
MKSVICVGHQGDVVIFEIDQFPNAPRVQDEMTKNGQLALGELSGHHHAFADNAAIDLFKLGEMKYSGLSFFETKKPAILEHGLMKGFKGREADQDYHSSVKFDLGRKFMTGIVVETDWISKTVRKVVD